MRATIIGITIVMSAAIASAQENPLTEHSKMLFEGTKRALIGSAEKMPEEHYSFKPAPAVRTFAQLIAHTADSQYMFCSAALGEKNPSAKVDATSKADLVAALKAAFGYCDKAYAAMTDKSAAETVKLHGRDTPRLGILAINQVHSIEHYGNLVTYLRMKDIVPPTSEPGFMAPPKKK